MRPAPSTCELTDDEALVARAIDDRQAFAVLYRRYVESVHRYCYRRLGNRTAAEDATSRTFERALGSLGGFRPEAGTFRAWLFGIAAHVTADALRARAPDGVVPLDAVPDLPDPAPSPESIALAAEERRSVQALLDRLPPAERNVVALRLAGLTSAEIAEALGRSRGALDIAQHRAIKRLRRLLDIADVEESQHGR